MAKGGQGAPILVAPGLRAAAGQLPLPEFYAEPHRIDAEKAQKGDRVSEIPHVNSLSGQRLTE